jgi:hypothetical protein
MVSQALLLKMDKTRGKQTRAVEGLKGFEIPEAESESRCGGLRMERLGERLGEREREGEEAGKEWSVGNEREDPKRKLGVD